MKKILITLSFSAISWLSFSQSCCEVKKDEMQLLASNKAFQRAHALPKPFKFFSLAGGEMLTFATPDNQKANAFLIKSAKPSDKYLFVYQEWWGLNDHIKKEAEHFYNELGGAVNVLAIDMYDGKVATTREDAGKFMGAANPVRLESIMKGALAFAGTKAKIASVGWCFGGGLSLKSALIEGKQAVGCVMYYGMPVKDVEQLKTLNCDVLGLFAGKEKWISTAVVKEFEENMGKAGKAIKVKSFDAEHAFANPSNPDYDKVATAEAWAMATEYLKKRLL
jgi:carboxymethylenebutenolidase